jgi:hypothetical protein
MDALITIVLFLLLLYVFSPDAKPEQTTGFTPGSILPKEEETNSTNRRSTGDKVQ